MRKWRNHAERSRVLERECEEFCEQLALRDSIEDGSFGRWFLRGPWSWVEVVTLRGGLYVGGDIETVVFSGHPSPRAGYPVRSAVYWMATKSYSYAAEKANIGRTQGNEWDDDCARASVLDQRKHDGLTREQARALFDCLDREEGERAFAAAVYEETGDAELCSMGDVVSRRVYLATAVLRRLVRHFDAQGMRERARAWFGGGGVGGWRAKALRHVRARARLCGMRYTIHDRRSPCALRNYIQSGRADSGEGDTQRTQGRIANQPRLVFNSAMP